METDNNGYLVRQYLYSSLYDRMSTRPFLEDIEKKWLAFQLLTALRDCHTRDVFHGDIKTENILVTSWNWLYLADFSSSFKPTTLPEDNPADFSYFFDTSGRRTCYVAPERFLAPGEDPDANAKMTWAMDVFSAGCAIAEMFLETPIFNLSQLYKYKRGEYDPMMHVNRIADKDIRELVGGMIQLDPERRYSADEYLSFWRNKAFPEYFYSFLHQYMALVTDPSSGRAPISGATINLGEADDRIDRIYLDFDKISYFLGYQSDKLDTRKPRPFQLRLQLLPVHLNIPNNDHQVSPLNRRPDDDGTLLFLTVVVAAVRNSARATARIRACDLLLAFSERLTDEAKLDRVLPYVVSLSNDKSDIVKIAAIRTLTQILALVKVISPVNSHVFQEYIIDRMNPFLDNQKTKPIPLVRATYAACLGSLASTAARFLDMVATLRADGSLPTVDPEAEALNQQPAAIYGVYDNTRAELIGTFERHTKALITDSDVSVRQAFLGSVPELCIFFGTTDANDIILSHLNTYLNGRDWELKCAFFETGVGVATFLGGVSLEEFILPLMVQALTDPEESVVEKVLRSLGHMAKLGLFQRAKIWELVEVIARFTMHPNVWIRQATAMFLASSTAYLSVADVQCVVLPLVRPYLKSDIGDLSEMKLLECLKSPLPRPVFDLATLWAVKVDRGVFWKSARQEKAFSFGSTNHAILAAASRDVTKNATSKIPRNEEDEQWISRLRTHGMTAGDEFKLLALREYIWRTAHLKPKTPLPQPSYLNDVVQLKSLGITPHSIIFDETFRENHECNVEATPTTDKGSSTVSEALVDAAMTIDDTTARRRQKGYNNHQARLDSHISNLSGIDTNDLVPGLIKGTLEMGQPNATMSSPPNGARGHLKELQSKNKTTEDDAASTASSRKANRQPSNAMSLLKKETAKSFPKKSTTSATTTTVLGKVEGPLKLTESQPSALVVAQKREEAKKADTRHRAPHTYSGNDPSILHMLDAMYVEVCPDSILEFGPMVAPLSRRKPITRGTAQEMNRPWQPAGVLVAQFAEHVGPINRVVVAPDHSFFITAGEDGQVKVWDTGRLERNVANRSRQTHKHNAGARAVSACFIENTHCFASCASDGSIDVVKVDYVNNSGVTAARYGKLKTIREYCLPRDEYAVWCEHYRHETSSVLMLATNTSRIIALDLRTMSPLYVLENPIHHGSPTCFLIDKRRHWMLVGTTQGALDLWDLRFRILVRSWGIPGLPAPVRRLSFHPYRGRGKWVCVAGGNDLNEITVWELEKLQCREVYRQEGTHEEKYPRNYNPVVVNEERQETLLGRFSTGHDTTSGKHTDHGIFGMMSGTDSYEDGADLKYGFMITGGSDRKLRFWDTADARHSFVMSGGDADEPSSTVRISQPSPTLTIVTERLPRSEPTAMNAAAGRSSSAQSVRSSDKKSNKSTVMMLNQRLVQRAHADAITDVALLEAPYGMILSVDRSGSVFVFQ